MSIDPRNLVLGTVLVAAALATGIIARVGNESTPISIERGSGPRGYYLQEAVLHGTDDVGRIFYRIIAERVEQSADGEDFELEDMRVEYTPDMDVQWIFSAARGLADVERNTLLLLDDVRLVYAAEAGQDEIVVETSELQLDAGGLYALTEKPVTLREGRSVMTATRLEVNLETDQWKLGLKDSEESDVTIRMPR